ncbi:hypothetical protein [Phaffia rhodozyma]|uniref:Uncharacterized protein n=1 Tax=Phaffia rhodozyma TaxID=264483 RepID=A0A0F7SPZ2_PHARH|nr:hypothetical protein [Phaffia rhodozyma]
MAVTTLPGPVGPISADTYFAPSPTFLPHHHRCSSSQSTIRPIPIQSPSLPRNTSGRMSDSGLTLFYSSHMVPTRVRSNTNRAAVRRGTLVFPS